jgi:hypothetical protein
MTAAKVSFKKDEVIVLLGAGASVDAGIPHSAAMVSQIEKALLHEWKCFKPLYDYVRSAIYYADGIQGTFDSHVPYNIERLVVALEELSRREEHPIYPFIGAWNPRLIQVAGASFEHVFDFKTKILEKLRHEWIEITNYENAGYFKGLVSFQKELNYPLRVFTLNYDLCVEKAYQSENGEFPERGFDKKRVWSHELLEDKTTAEKNVYLYKLHGSIDWVRDASTGKITYYDSTSKIRPDDGALIFGTTYKLQYVDPFLFLVYQLRRLSLDARLLLVIGYGFGDEHINGIVKQALRTGGNKRLVVVTYFGTVEGYQLKDKEAEFRSFVAKQLEIEDSDPRLIVRIARAKEFMSGQLSLEAMSALFPAEEEIFEELPSPNN